MVTADDDLVGHVAYALYKRDKLKFCNALRAKHSRDPSKTEIDTFINAAGLDTRIQAYRNEAESLLEQFAEIVLADVEVKFDRSRDKEIKDRLTQRESFGRAVVTNLVANVAGVILLFLLFVFAFADRIDFGEVIADMAGYEKRDDEPKLQIKPADPQLPVEPAERTR